MLRSASEKVQYIDSYTGAEVTRLTSYRAHSNHLYFTNNSFYDNGNRIVFESDRGNGLNYFSLDLQTGEIDQLTDLPQMPYPGEYPLHEGFVDGTKGNCCFFYGKILYRLSLENKSLTPIYRIPDGYIHHILSISHDGEYVYTSIIRCEADRGSGDLPLHKIFESNPTSQIIRIPIGGGPETVVWEENSFIAHVNVSPTDSTKLTFCHEGPWNLVDHRLWYADLAANRVGKLHECQPAETIGHEYWYADGKRIGYHGSINGVSQLGVVNFDGTGDCSFPFPFEIGHIFSQDEKLIVGDGGNAANFMRVWQLTKDGYAAPHALCAHNCSFRRQRAHVHPRMTPDGKAVLYTSDETGYEQVYLVKLPEDISALPLLETLSYLEG